jgi:hypothetical protein
MADISLQKTAKTAKKGWTAPMGETRNEDWLTGGDAVERLDRGAIDVAVAHGAA